ncbi:MAG TPA: nickel insertion protein, partial [Gemmatimonadaceae bacterium]|nr:nickel insertion protein [Gemmatimonadaceae bacterium]
LILAEPVAQDGRQVLVTLTADLDDMSGEYVANVADALRTAGALDVVLVPTIMKKGRPGVRVEVLAAPALADQLESMLLADSTTLGVRRTTTERRALPRTERTVEVLGYAIRVKVAVQPDGTERAKPEFDDVRRVAEATQRAAHDIFSLAAEAARHPSQLPGE